MKPLPTWIDDRSREQLLDLGREIADHVPGAEVALDHRRVELGDRLVVTTNYALESLVKLDKVAQNIVMGCRRKYAGAAS